MVVGGYMILHGTVTRGGSRGGMQGPPSSHYSHEGSGRQPKARLA